MFRAMIVGLAGLVAPAAHAATPLPCNSCVADADFRKAAQDKEAETGKGGTYWVYNLRDGTVQTWAITPSGLGDRGGAPRSAPGPASMQATQGSVQDEVATAHTMYRVGGDSLRPIYNVPVESLHLAAARGKSIYDVLHDNNLKAQVESALGSNQTLMMIVNQDVVGAMVDVAQEGTNMLDLKKDTQVIFHLVMSDGTSMDFFLNVTQTTADAQENTARTASGELIPESIIRSSTSDAGSSMSFIPGGSKAGVSISQTVSPGQ